MNFIALLAVTALMGSSCLAQTPQNPTRFIVDVVTYQTGLLNNETVTQFQCHATFFRSNHVLAAKSRRFILTVASCLQPLRFNTPIGVIARGTENETFSETQYFTLNPVEDIIIHPDFHITNTLRNNVAVIRLPVDINIPSFQRRELVMGLGTNVTCRLFGWGGSNLNPRAEQVEVFNPTFCNNNETQASCTVFPNGAASQCQATLGSPIFCGDFNFEFSAIAQHGFLISDTRQTGGFCKEIGGHYSNQYHSIEDFHDWITRVSAGENFTAPLAMISSFIGYFLYFNFLW